MKNIWLLVCLSFCLLTSSQGKLELLDKSDMETTILFLNFPVIDINDYQNSSINYYSFLQAYKAIANHDLQKRLTEVNVFENRLNQNKTSSVNLGILHSQYEIINQEEIANGNIQADSEGNLKRVNNDVSIYIKKVLSIASPLKKKHKGLKTEFTLTKNEIFNTTDNDIISVKIDFDDGNGFIDVPINSSISVEYKDKGTKEINTHLTFSDGYSTKSLSLLEVTYSASDINQLYNRTIQELPSQGSINSIAPNLTPYGVTNDIGKAEYDIFLSNDNILDKPIFLIDGFDPGDSRNILGLYDLLNFNDSGQPSNLADIVRSQGFDVVILNFPVYIRESDQTEIDGGSDFIERNAMLLVELIEIINNNKVGNQQNVIIGPSMGGLISRYALNFMEQQNIIHDTRLWISFDSPHHGANVPISLQYLFNNLAYNLNLGGLGGDQSIVALRPLIDGMLKSPAARQMLVDQFESHINSTIVTPIPHPYHNIFYSEINSLTLSGFPELTRNVSVINGSGINKRYPDKNGMDVLPDREILNTTIEIEAGITDATFKTRLTPYQSNTNESSYIYIDTVWICFCDLTLSENSEAFSFTDGVDSASGGLFNIADLNGSFETDPIIDSFFAALQTDYFNFIPTISSMALDIVNNQVNWFHTPSDLETRVVNNVTPFDNWYMPNDNESHVTLTEENVNFTLEEILQETLNLNEQNNDFGIRLEQNPIQDKLVILSKQYHTNVRLKITELTGKMVLDKNMPLGERTRISVNIDSGMYLLSIISDSISYQTKLIKR